MDRRTFLGAAVAPLLAGSLEGSPPAEWTDPLLGRYVRHHCQPGDPGWIESVVPPPDFEQPFRPDDPPSPPRRKRYVSFPIENTLVVEFERGCCQYVNYNGSRDLVGRVNAMGPARLFGHAAQTLPAAADPPAFLAAEFAFADPVSIVWELQGYGDRLRRGKKPALFRLQAVNYSPTTK